MYIQWWSEFHPRILLPRQQSTGKGHAIFTCNSNAVIEFGSPHVVLLGACSWVITSLLFALITSYELISSIDFLCENPFSCLFQVLFLSSILLTFFVYLFVCFVLFCFFWSGILVCRTHRARCVSKSISVSMARTRTQT